MFPVRSMTDSIYLTPEQLPMFMQPSVRRAVVMLRKIHKQRAIVVVAATNYGGQPSRLSLERLGP